VIASFCSKDEKKVRLRKWICRATVCMYVGGDDHISQLTDYHPMK
jgi:hypothetical protein